jgi:hypothetical protein
MGLKVEKVLYPFYNNKKHGRTIEVHQGSID